MLSGVVIISEWKTGSSMIYASDIIEPQQPSRNKAA
jgi:hypothetical protein